MTSPNPNNVDADQLALVTGAFAEGHAAAMASMQAHMTQPGGGIDPAELAAHPHIEPPLPVHLDLEIATQGHRGGGERS